MNGLDERDILEEFDEDNESMEGFTIVDDSGAVIIDGFAAPEETEEEAVVASPIPDNIITVIIDNAAYDLPGETETLEIELKDQSGAVFFGKQKIGDFKPAFVKKLKGDKAGMYVSAKMHSYENPVMVKLFLSPRPKKGTIKIEPLKSTD